MKLICVSLAALLSAASPASAFVPSLSKFSWRGNDFLSQNSRSTALSMAPPPKREDEIRRKIMRLKKEGKIKNKDPSFEMEDDTEESLSMSEEIALDKLRRETIRGNPLVGEYADKIKAKLGQNNRLLSNLQNEETSTSATPRRMGRLGSLRDESSDDVNTEQSTEQLNVLNEKADSKHDAPDDEEDVDVDDETALVDLVAKKLAEKPSITNQEQLSKVNMAKSAETEEAELMMKSSVGGTKNDQEKELKQTTSGIGGSWSGDQTESVETYKPSRGSWGAFPRPKDISKAYGGGKQIGVAATGEVKSDDSVAETRDKLRRYREKVGIEVQSEKDHAAEIEEALNIGMYAMQRGMYSTAVTALEKVTKYCSSNSKIGSKVFLELAMAYEATGQTPQAIVVYTALTTCRMEDVKYNAKRLLYGIEAMNFMRNEAKSEEFSKKKAAEAFIDTTGLKNIAQNFDDRYNTAYIDLEKGGGFYRKLTESVVRSPREARQVLLQAVGSGEVKRMKVVQALRSLGRYFDDALKDEIKRATPVEEVEPVAVINGVPIAPTIVEEDKEDTMSVLDGFVLGSSSQMMDLLNGEWRLQLLADLKGDGVRYYNSTLSWQDIDGMQFKSYATAGFVSLSQKGEMEFQEQERILRRLEVSTSVPGGFLGSIVAGSAGGAATVVTAPQQIITVDSVLLVTRLAAEVVKKTSDDNVKDYFSVWRRVEPGTYSKTKSP